MQVLAVSCDPCTTLRAFADAEGYDFPLLSDFWPHGEVARSYGVFNDELGFAMRGHVPRRPRRRRALERRQRLGQARDLAGYHAALAAA